jgi:proteasome lid subunit RPN8/RPN11
MKRKRAARVLLATPAWKTLLLDVCARREIEACGALLGTIDQEGNWRIAEAVPLRNVSASPVYFEFEPAELLAVDLEHPGRMIGVYHSHPAGPLMASSTDQQNMRRVNLEQQIPWVWLILSGPFSSSPPGEAKITLKGVIAYHHYRDLGLQRIPIQRVEQEQVAPAPGF